MIELQPKHSAIVRDILHCYLSNYEVWAFGSRVTGTAKPYSDLDLVVITNIPINFGLMGTIRDAFSESDLPFKVDLLDWASTSQEFREIIKKNYEIIQTGNNI